MNGQSLSSQPPEEALVLENLIKAFSRRFIECRIEEGSNAEQILDYECVFSRKSLPKNITSLYDLEARFREPHFMGRTLHLASHIRHTKFNDHISVQESPKKDVLWWLEDLRAETLFLKNRPLDNHNFRVLVNKSLERYKSIEDLSSLEISLVYLMIVGRKNNGVFLNHEVEGIQDKLESILPTNIQQKFLDIINEYLTIPDASDGIQASLLAERWLDLTDAQLSPLFAKECMDKHLLMTPADGAGEFSDEESSDQVTDSDQVSDASQDFENEKSESIEDSGMETEETNSMEEAESDNSSVESNNTESSSDSMHDNNDAAEEIEEALDDLVNDFDDEIKSSKPVVLSNLEKEKTKAEKDAIKEMLKTAKQVFPKESLTYKTRKPVQSDFQLASQLSSILQKAKWRAPKRYPVRSQTPPGRLNSRDAVNLSAQRAMGLPQTIEPFRRVVTVREESPPLLLGMGCDISGSMSDSVEPMSKLMWACSRAVPRVGGTFAAVSFGRNVKGLVKPGHRVNQVPVLSAKANYEAAYGAILSLTGSLGYMERKPGVKVLILSTDGEWRREQIDTSLPLLKKLESDFNVHIFWIPFQGDFYHSNIKNDPYLRHLPLAQVGSVVTFDKLSSAPLELGKIIANKIGPQ